MRIALLSLAIFIPMSIVSPLCLADGQKNEIAPPAGSAGVEDLAFSDFYVMPVGPLGLEPTPKLLSLRGKRVRLIGYMVHEEEPTGGVFMLATRPVQLAEVADGPADDLPAATVFVHVPAEDGNRVVPFRPGAWTLTGTLELGAQVENDGRMSYTRLRLGTAPIEQSATPANEEQSSRRPRS